MPVHTMVILDRSGFKIVIMFDNDNIINSLTTISIDIHTKMHICTNIHSINIHSYTIQITGPIQQ